MDRTKECRHYIDPIIVASNFYKNFEKSDQHFLTF